MSAELRRYPRIPLDQPCELELAGSVRVASTLKALSCQGATVLSATQVRRHSVMIAEGPSYPDLAERLQQQWTDHGSRATHLLPRRAHHHPARPNRVGRRKHRGLAPAHGKRRRRDKACLRNLDRTAN